MSDSFKSRLAQFGQSQLLRWVDELSPAAQQQLLAQIETIDFQQLQSLVAGEDHTVDWAAMSSKAMPPQPYAWASPTRVSRKATRRRQAKGHSNKAKWPCCWWPADKVRDWASICPRACFLSACRGRTLFQMVCDRLIAMSRRYGHDIPLYIMTSPATDSATRDYFQSEDGCGLAADQLNYFCQGQMPAVDAKTGKVLLADKGEVALSPTVTVAS